VARVFVTGATQGLGRIAAEQLLAGGHRVVAHARDERRRAGLADLVTRGADVVVGDLAEDGQTRALAEQVNRLGRMDAVIHNAAVSTGPAVFEVNVVAPYLLTALIERPPRLVYLSSGMHRGGRAELGGRVSYSDSKLLVTVIAMAVARLWPDVLSNAVNPGWVPTRMGGRSAPDDLQAGAETQVWLATSDDPDARTSGGYWYHRRREQRHPTVDDEAFQDQLLDVLAARTGLALA
jgi:NAD(P)-dependent dehydrogenase (short-subunit alcohol dehydrogenase family)